MSIFARTAPVTAAMAMAALLSGCDMAAEQVGSQMRDTVVQQCQSVSESAGIAGDQVAAICECTADTVMQKNVDELTQIDRARVQEIVVACAGDTGAANSNPDMETAGA